MAYKNKQVLLARRPQGWVQESDFRIVENEVPPLSDGQVLVQNAFLSLDPYMRGRMSTAKSYAKSTEIGDVMTAGTVGTIIESKNKEWHVGDRVQGQLGWQLYGISDGKGLRKLPADDSLSLSLYLGALGMPAVTAWVGLNLIGEPKANETVVVSAASGAVGSVVGQLAKLKGCRAVGIAGGKTKCDYVVNELGLDACIDYKAGHLSEDLAAATPSGIDVYFDNVGGEILDMVLTRLNAFARIPLCGMISQYNAEEPYRLQNFRAFLTDRARLQGFIVGEYARYWPQALQELSDLVRSGRLKYRESIVEGLDNAPRAFIGLLKGENLGKQLVKLQ